MSLQWTLIAGFLLAEVVIVLLLSFPIVSPSKLHKLFKSKFLKALLQQSKKYFGFILFALVLFLCDSIRELRKYSDISAEERDKYANLDSEMLIQLRLFRAQRNFYVCSFTLVLSVVIRRLILLIDEQAALLKALKNQPQSAEGGKSDQLSVVEKNNEEANHRHVAELQERITELEWELKREKKEKEVVSSQVRTRGAKEEELLTNEQVREKLVSGNDKKSI